MLDICLLGRGGMYPLPERFLTSLYVTYKGNTILIDCGEGTQVAIRSNRLGFKQIGTICFTHFHADHIAGLPGLLLTIGNSGRTEPVLIVGPVGVQHVVERLCIIAEYLPFELVYNEIEKPFTEFTVSDLKIRAQWVDHRIDCFGYSVELPRQGKFDPQRAKELDIPISMWRKLQNGESVIVNGASIEPNAVIGKARKGLKLVYTTDLRPSDDMIALAKDADLFVCEGIYGDDEKANKALEYHHCLFSEAAQMAKKAQVKELWLTHFSPSMVNPDEFLSVATDIFENTLIDKNSTTLLFSE